MAYNRVTAQLNRTYEPTPYPDVPDKRTSKREKRKKKAIKRAKINAAAKASAKVKDRNLIFVFFILIGILAVSLICFLAYSESIKHDINQTNREIVTISEEIDILNVEIEESQDIGQIEKKALNDLDMVYPTADQLVYIGDIKPMKEDMAQLIRENAYELW